MTFVIDPTHAAAIAAATEHDPVRGVSIKLDVEFMQTALDRLSLWESGLLADTIARAAEATHPNNEQRVLLALFIHRGQS